MYLENNWAHTKNWMLEALNLFDKEKDHGQLDVNLVYEHLRFAEFKVHIYSIYIYTNSVVHLSLSVIITFISK